MKINTNSAAATPKTAIIILLTTIFLMCSTILTAQTPDKEELWSQGLFDIDDYAVSTNYSYNTQTKLLFLNFNKSKKYLRDEPMFSFDLQSGNLNNIFLPNLPAGLPKICFYNNYCETEARIDQKYNSRLYYLMNNPSFVIIYDMEKMETYKIYPILINNLNYRFINYFKNINNKKFLIQTESKNNAGLYQLDNDTIKFVKYINAVYPNLYVDNQLQNLVSTAIQSNTGIGITKFDFDGNQISSESLPNISEKPITNCLMSPDCKYLYLSNQSGDTTNSLTIYNLQSREAVYSTDDIFMFDRNYSVTDNDYFAYFTKGLDLELVNLVTGDKNEIKSENFNFLNATRFNSNNLLYTLYLGDNKFLINTGYEFFEFDATDNNDILLAKSSGEDFVKFSPENKFIFSNGFHYSRVQRISDKKLIPFDLTYYSYNAFAFFNKSNQLIKSSNRTPYFTDSLLIFNYSPDFEKNFTVKRSLFLDPTSLSRNIEVSPSDNYICFESSNNHCAIMDYPNLTTVFKPIFYSMLDGKFFNDSTLVFLNVNNQFYLKQWDYAFFDFLNSKTDTISIPYTKPGNGEFGYADSSFVNLFTIRDTMVVSNAAPGDSVNLYYMFNQNVFIKKPTNDFFRGRVVDFQFIPKSKYALVLTRDCRLYAVNTDNIDDYREIKYTGVDMISSVIEQYNRWTGYLKISPDGSRAFLRTTFTENCFDLSGFTDVKDDRTEHRNQNFVQNQLVEDNLIINPDYPVEFSQIDFFTLNGKKAKSLTGDLNYTGKSSIYIGDLPVGAYFVRFIGNKGVSTAYFIKD